MRVHYVILDYKNNLKNNQMNTIFKDYAIALYNAYVADGSNIDKTAKLNQITNTECFNIVKMGEKYSKGLNK